MILNLLLFTTFFDIFILIHANDKFHVGIINHNTQWYFHCPQNNTKMLDPPSNDQPLISYECPYRLTTIEILPAEIDFTFLCRLQSRLIWIIIDLYQYNTFLWLIDNKDLEIKIELNNKIQINNSESEMNNYTNRLIIINAFYIPFESIDLLLNESIEINIEIKNLYQLNQCQFFIKDNYLWETFINNHCDSTQSKTLIVQYAKCDFYSNTSKLINEDLDNPLLTTTSSSIPDFNIILSINDDQTTATSMSEQNSTHYHHHYLLLEENSRQILASLARSAKNSILLKLTFIFLIIILIILIIFFVYMLCYHYHIRLRSSSSLIKKSSVSI